MLIAILLLEERKFLVENRRTTQIRPSAGCVFRLFGGGGSPGGDL